MVELFGKLNSKRCIVRCKFRITRIKVSLNDAIITGAIIIGNKIYAGNIICARNVPLFVNELYTVTLRFHDTPDEDQEDGQQEQEQGKDEE